MGKISVSKDHILARSNGNFGISSYQQELMCYLGQEHTFSQASFTFEKLKQLEVNAKQIERVCHYYGQLLEETLLGQIQSGEAKAQKSGLHYAMLDGSMVLTREPGWKEMKLGRVFVEEDKVEVNKDRQEVLSSDYVAHLGGHQEFCQKFEYYLDGIEELVIVADGATWIWDWANSFYPESTQILDFYHAKEHLSDFAKVHFKEEQARNCWIEEASEQLLEDEIEALLTKIQALETKTKKTQESKQQLIHYYQKNKERMKYKTFQEKGLLIGSGPIESAHRNVIQKRMKLSGQRWTKKGVQQIANLRTLHLSKQWHKLVQFTQVAA